MLNHTPPSFASGHSHSPVANPREYEDLLVAMHEAQADVIRLMVSEAGIERASRVLDLGCGDGYYVEQLSHVVGPNGHITGVDLDEQLLQAAERRSRALPAPCSFVREEGTRLPWPDATFDVAFSALCFFDFPNPVEVLAEMKRVTRPGGLLVVIEHDSNHQALFPYPPTLEMAMSQALKRASQHLPGVSTRFYAARRLPEWLARLGLVNVDRRSYSADMTHPLSPTQARFIDLFLDEQARHVRPFLDADSRKLLAAWRAGKTERPAPDAPGFAASFFHFVTTGNLAGSER